MGIKIVSKIDIPGQVLPVPYLSLNLHSSGDAVKPITLNRFPPILPKVKSFEH